MSFASFVYYPKWKNFGSEATISWDVSGYYFYLPAIFIYKDLKQIQFKDDILSKYQPTFELQQANLHSSGNYVMRYSCGMAIQYLPFFALAHIYAQNSAYEADGFSRPYQFMMSLGSIIVALIGLLMLRKVLLNYYGDTTVAFTIIAIVMASNYFDYASINGAMSHNYLFTLYALLLLLTHKFYKKPGFTTAIGIGVTIGLAALSRPTEILLCLVPLLWGMKTPLGVFISDKYIFIRNNSYKLMSAIIACLLVGSVQFIYWKWATGEWIVYSYGNEGFDWFSPHLKKGLFSYTSGWLVYSPIMAFALLGFYTLYKKRSPSFYSIFCFMILFIYIAFAWKNWWYGGSLGQRTMVQTYPLLAFPLAAFIESIQSKKWINWLSLSLLAIFVYYNIWLTHQAHKGGLFMAGQMTKDYFWASLGQYKVHPDTYKLLDTKEIYTKERNGVQLIGQMDFEMDSTAIKCNLKPIKGNASLCLNEQIQWSSEYDFQFRDSEAEWIRARATFRSHQKEWNHWRMPQFILKFYNGDQLIKQSMIRVFRLMSERETKELYIDSKIPGKHIDRIAVQFYNAESSKSLQIDDLIVEGFVGS